MRECNESSNKPGERHKKVETTGLNIEKANKALSTSFASRHESANSIATKT